MNSDKYRSEVAAAIAKAVKRIYPDVVDIEHDLRESSIRNSFEKPKDPTMGRFALPMFKYTRLLKDKPQEIAAKVSEEVNRILGTSAVCSTVNISGFVNVRVEFNSLATETIRQILTLESRYGDSDIGQNRKYLVEYSSANIAKPFGIGHLRSTVIGNSLRRINRKLGYDVMGINFLGDWGTQFGKMIIAYRKWGGDVNLEDNAVSELLDLYVRFHREAEKDDSLNEEARLAFKMLEDNNPEARKLWDKFKAISMAEFDRIYRILGVEFDWVTGEAFLNDKMNAVIERLQKSGLTKLSDGALIVDLDDPQLPPCLLRKGDGATLYATRDLAGLIYRWDSYRFAESLYVVGSEQADHFKQAFKVIAMLEDAENLSEDDRMTGRVKHIGFGWVRFGAQKLSTREGRIIFLEDVIDKAVALAKEKIREKNPDLRKIDETALMIGVGAVIFAQLSVRRLKDVNFIWEEVLNFEGETGPYLQYTHARLCSLMRNYIGEIDYKFNTTLLDKDEECRVIELLADYPSAIEDAASAYDPHIIAVYLLKLSGAFNKVYQRKNDRGRIDKIISEDNNLSRARMALVKSVQIVIRDGLWLLGLQAPEEM
ncbi:MAG: arginine--tRNA ligase [candidate division Zixibacteria bacterium]|nr:arginine--tRNA ligase [candidate division Zixibacteria bacterium]